MIFATVGPLKLNSFERSAIVAPLFYLSKEAGEKEPIGDCKMS